MHRNEVLGKILGEGLVPILVDDRLPAESCAEQVLASGLEVIEVSCRHPIALKVIGEIKKRFPQLAVGAASLIEDGRYLNAIRAAGGNVPGIEQAAGAGADFLVSMLPFRRGTYDKFARTHVIIPGVATPGEAQQALDWGANLVKFCNPHLLGGPEFFRGIDAASHRGFPFFITGGIRPEAVGEYVEAQVLVFAAGFDIILGEWYARADGRAATNLLRDALGRYTTAIRRARRQHQGQIPFESKDPAAIAAASGRCLNESP